MLDFFRRQLRPKYEPLNSIEINKQALLANFDLLQKAQPDAAIIPVLKANAYGHGLKEVCAILNDSPAKMIAVDSFPEAQVARKYFRGRVLIIGEMPAGAYAYCDFKRTAFTVYNLETLKILARYGATVHLFLNSGMNREGIKDLDEFLRLGRPYLDKVKIEGFCSHLASAETPSELNMRQEERFLEALNQLRLAGFNPKYIHLGNSAGIFTLNNPVFTAFRAGLSFYGYNPFPKNSPNFIKADKLQPVLVIKSKIVSVQNLSTGETVSYNETYQVKKPSKIAVIPFGYYEGLDRRLSGNFKALYKHNNREFLANIAGKVCMNLCCLDMEDIDAKVGDSVILMGQEQGIGAEDWAASMNTIVYEVLVKLQANIRRIIV
jgi:alanine racemase